MPCVAVAYSGGLDSTALLHATCLAARELPEVCVVALHIHHGLNPRADEWLSHAERTCGDWASQGLPVRLLSRRVSVRQGPGLSVEAEARRQRHAALQELAQASGADLLLLAHHRRDQAETLLLQALRGGGLAGLAAMPRESWRGGVKWVRPWLDRPREDIEAHIRRHGLTHIDDDSNGDPRFARNRLRLHVWPALQAAFPDVESTLAASAARLGDALPALAAWQRASEAGWCEAGDRSPPELDAVAWASQAPWARREALRHWYRSVSGSRLGATWVTRLADEVPQVLARGGVARWPSANLALYRGRLSWCPRLEGEGAPATDQTGAHRKAPLQIDGPGDWPVPGWHGFVRVKVCELGGVEPERVRALHARPRAGGERFQLGEGRPARDLKRQYQAAGVPAWERDGPLLWSGESLIFVPGLGLDARVVAPPGVPQWTLSWHRPG